VGCVTGEVAALPLARLFAMAYRDLIDGLHDRLARRGWADIRPAFGFVLLAARDTPTTTTELAALMGTTKQAASKLAASMLNAGYLMDAPREIADGRIRPLQLSESGAKLLAAVEELYAELEAEWAEIIGVNSLERLRRDLTRVIVASHGGALPAVRPTW
jgi:DNA-binding MarR family transcriptional regulator